jgi:hypothetical protein
MGIKVPLPSWLAKVGSKDNKKLLYMCAVVFTFTSGHAGRFVACKCSILNSLLNICSVSDCSCKYSMESIIKMTIKTTRCHSFFTSRYEFFFFHYGPLKLTMSIPQKIINQLTFPKPTFDQAPIALTHELHKALVAQDSNSSKFITKYFPSLP